MFKTVWLGIDIGSYSVKAVEITRSGNQLYMTGVVKLRTDETQDDSSELAYRLFNRLQEAKIHTSYAVLGVPQKSAILSPVHVPRAEPARIRKMLEFEMQQMGERVGDTTHDYNMLNLPTLRNEVCALVALARNEELSSNYQLMELSKISVRESTISPFALFQTFKTCRPDRADSSCMLVNVGHEFTDLVLVDQGELIFARSVGFGGRHFNDAIVQQFNLTPKDADALKIAKGSLRDGEMAANPEANELNTILKGQAAQLANTLTSTLKFSATQLKISKITVDQIYITGGGAKLDGLTDYLQRQLQKPVETLNPFQTINLEGLSERLTDTPSDLSIAAGLACVGLDRRLKILDLLPIEVKQRREFVTRKLFSYIAAGFMVACFALSWGFKSWATSVASKERGDRQTVLQNLDKSIQDYQAIANKIESMNVRMDCLAGHANGKAPAALEQFLEQLFTGFMDWPSIELSLVTIDNEFIKQTDQEKEFGGQRLRPYVQLEGSATETRKQPVEEVYNEFKSFLIALAGSENVRYLPTDNSERDASEFHFKLMVFLPMEGVSRGQHP